MGIFGYSLPPGCGTLPGEESGAYEHQIDGVWYAWDEDDRVYAYEPKAPEARDDGYVYIGQIVWPENMGPEEEPSSLLVEFVRNFRRVSMQTLEAFKRGDGAHRGLSDWYTEKEAALKVALDAHAPFDTGWYGSKHEIASARIRSDDGVTIKVEASVSDDFDTEGSGSRTTTDWTLEAVAAAVNAAWDAANEHSRWLGFSIHDSTGAWIETYILSTGEYDTPPGDNYHWWGWQHDEQDEVGIPHPDIPADAVKAFEKFSYGDGEELCVNRWTIRRWK